MRYRDLFEDSNPQSDIMDFITNLKAQGANSVSVDQIIQMLNSDPSMYNLNIDDSMVNDIVDQIPNTSIGKDDNGEDTVFFSDQGNTAPIKKDIEKADQDINKAAMKTLDKGPVL
jgi:hypothetical protein